MTRTRIHADITIDGVAYLRPATVSAMCDGSPTTGTLAVWRTLGKGPGFIKMGTKVPGCRLDRRPVLYPLTEVQAWLAGSPVQHQTIAA
ncbi:hypothetical protein JS533_001535 [Bifidobacterium amazonense]|uniref:DNA-binding protein n=1 Tax=Bifidobacterium amazonense TaxID=2809027 RepID=A0ABS9VSN6_9BIFI|nr:hypothetical protein [Bifidobacterium amazonense]MCH9274971.1 hypothetical protein [Bifidobacterium amazonense]